MTTVLLVDDEPLCLIGMQSMINWKSLGFELVGAVRNGADALEMIRTRKPDVVITDLMMPVMGGLELAEKCREEDPSLPVFIMLTNYEEFDYIKKSMHLGAVEYLIKIDLTAQALSAALNRAREQVGRENMLRDAECRPSRGNLEQYREILFLRLFSGLFSSRENFEAHCARLDQHFDAPHYTVAYAALEKKELPISEQATLCSCVTKMAADILPKYLRGCTVSGMDLEHFAVLIPLDTPEIQEEIIAKALNQAGVILLQYFNVRLQWAVGLPVSDILMLRDSLRSAASLLTQMKPEQSVCFCRVTNKTPLDYRAQLVERIQNYISRNLSQKLTLNDVAAVFNFSPSYLSQLLSKDGEAGFVEFVTATRIQTAKELMAGSDMKIYEISDRVGFESASYFSKVFKKLEGVSPREYLQRLWEE